MGALVGRAGRRPMAAARQPPAGGVRGGSTASGAKNFALKTSGWRPRWINWLWHHTLFTKNVKVHVNGDRASRSGSARRQPCRRLPCRGSHVRRGNKRLPSRPPLHQTLRPHQVHPVRCVTNVGANVATCPGRPPLHVVAPAAGSRWTWPARAASRVPQTTVGKRPSGGTLCTTGEGGKHSCNVVPPATPPPKTAGYGGEQGDPAGPKFRSPHEPSGWGNGDQTASRPPHRGARPRSTLRGDKATTPSRPRRVAKGRHRQDRDTALGTLPTAAGLAPGGHGTAAVRPFNRTRPTEVQRSR